MAASTPSPPLVLNPSDVLKFRFELRKQIPTTLKLTNPGAAPVAFKVKTTSPKKYCVRPNTGVIPAGGSLEVQVIMQAQKEPPADLPACKDKFLVQSVAVSGEQAEALRSGAGEKVGALFDAAGGPGAAPAGTVAEAKLKVAYLQPPPPPSPVAEEGGEAAGGGGTPAPSSAAAAGRAAAPPQQPPSPVGAPYFSAAAAAQQQPAAAAAQPSAPAAAQPAGGADPASAAASLRAELAALRDKYAALQQQQQQQQQQGASAAAARPPAAAAAAGGWDGKAGGAARAPPGGGAVAAAGGVWGSPARTPGRALAFTLLHLLLTAVIAFALGRLL